MSIHAYVLAAQLGCAVLSGTAFAEAVESKVAARVTIGDQTIALPHARAFSTGMPFVLIYFTEKPLDSFVYGTAGNDETWSGGRYGTVLRLAPALDPESEGKPVERYVIPGAAANEDDRVMLRSARINNWQEQWLSQNGIEIAELESSSGVVRGKLS